MNLIRDLIAMEEGTKQRPRGRAGLVYSRNSEAILEQEREEMRWKWRRCCMALRKICGLNPDGTALEILGRAGSL